MRASQRQNEVAVLAKRYWRRWPVAITSLVLASLPITFLACVSPNSVSAGSGEVVKITAINDNYDPNHATEVDVQPGDVVTLSADLLDSNNNFQAKGASVESFIWSADDQAQNQSNDLCDASQSADCLAASNFQVTDYGVSFYVPYSIGDQIVISVTSSDPSAVDANGVASVDTIVLKNLAFQQSGYVPPTQIVTDPAQYTYPTVDPDYALAGQGRWVVVSGSRYWVPYTYVANGDNDWAPYRNGYWNWDDSLGYTWVSYDPWGWMTDHYGIWRFHGVYGWVWLPFDDMHYEPHTISWFDSDQDGRIGWYPYFPGYARGYAHGFNEGFMDGYEHGFDGCKGCGEGGYQWHNGFTIVLYEHFREGNIVNFYERGEDEVVVRVVNYGYGNGRFSQFPGRADNARDGHDYVRNVCGDVDSVHSEGMGPRGIMNPVRNNQVPSVYGKIGSANDINRRDPVGSVIGGADQGRPGMVPPTTNGRGIVAPPRAPDPSTGVMRPLPPQSQRPAQPNQNNPISTHQPIAPKPGEGPVPPVYHPGQPTPAPVHPAPVPQPPHPAPQPQPPHPAPQPQPPHPAPQPQPPHPAPQPQPPHPAPQPQPPHPAPQPQPPHPAPQPQPPHPAPQPQPPHPAPQPQPPHPAPQPQPPHPAPQPQPPHPAPQPPHPAPAPHPGPGPHHDPAGDQV